MSTLWITNTLIVATILSGIACTWHLACFSAQEFATRRLRKRFPNIRYV